jgi:CubicO group peptidase (beta-lactamase class C family)
MKKIFSVSLLLLVIASAYSQPLTSQEIDRIVQQTMETFDVPGIAVAVVRDNKVIHMRGYGVRSLDTGKEMDENTLFAIASNSKAFTSAALGILIDEGKLSWDTKVIDIIPEFRLYNPYVTSDFNIKDLLTHRSGMGLGAGDLMMWPGSPSFTRQDIIHNLRYLKQTSPFRTKYDYDNLLYIVAGVVVERVSGMSWEAFVEERIMQPLEMDNSAASINRLKDRSNIIDAHVPVDGVLQVVPKHESDVHNPAGGIFSSVADMSKWIMMQMNDGRYGEKLDKRIFSEEVHREMWTPQTIIPLRSGGPYKSHFSSYGLGWRLTDVCGYLQASHTGGLMGIVTQVTLIPEIRLGIIVFTNQQQGAAFTAITNEIKDGYLGVKSIDWISLLKEGVDRSQAEAEKITDELWARVDEQRAKSDQPFSNSLFTGTYTDDWFGDIIISDNRGNLRFTCVKSPGLKGDMFFYTGNTFIIRWDDRTLDADAFVIFTLDREGIPCMIKMEAISPLTDFSFDFHDLTLVRKPE